MKTVTKIVIGVIVTILLILGLIVGGFFSLVFFVDRSSQKHAQKVEQAKNAGREFGRTTDENGCIEKGFSLKTEIKSFDKVILEYVGECLESSEPTPNFCDGVPEYDYENSWNDKQCEKVPKDAPCHDTIYAKQSYCKFFQKRDQANVDGREFGKTTDQNGCIEKGFTLPNDFSNKMSFTSGCLRTSRPTTDFCKGVPYRDSDWNDEQCKKAGDNKDSCIQSFNAKQSFCR
jgi:hypothetical protein